jgi:hypothetical protein
MVETMALTNASNLGTVRSWAQRQAEIYRHGEDRPLGGYLTLMGTYGAATAALALAAKRFGRAPHSISPWDLAQMAVATHKVARRVTKDPVTSPLRAPFTIYEGTGAPGELSEQVRGDGIKHSIGELLTCPMCLGQWVATGFCLALVVAPTPTRLVMATFTATAGADFLQHLYVRLQQATA